MKNLKKIYFKNPNTENLNELLLSLYEYNGYSSPTYHDEKFIEIQCQGHRRSFEDLLAIANTYFPKTTEKELLKSLIEIKMKFYFCNVIRKLVFHFNGSFLITKFNFENIKPCAITKDSYTPKMLIEILEKI